MDWLNYHHLLYFWQVAKSGSIAAASKNLKVSQPTISAQIKALESSLGHDLFERRGRGLVLTDVGRTVFAYADDIFQLGQEMLSSLNQGPVDKPVRLNVGIVDSLPKLVVQEIIKPAFKRRKKETHVVFSEGRMDELITLLSSYKLDLILSNQAFKPSRDIKINSQLLGQSGITFYAESSLAQKLSKQFPKSLHNAPALLPTVHASVRRSLTQWFKETEIKPMIIAEFDDLALMKTFAAEGHGFTAVHSVIQKAIASRYGIVPIGEAEGCLDHFYAISVDRKMHHPIVAAILKKAGHLFQQ